METWRSSISFDHFRQFFRNVYIEILLDCNLAFPNHLEYYNFQQLPVPFGDPKLKFSWLQGEVFQFHPGLLISQGQEADLLWFTYKLMMLLAEVSISFY